MVRKTTRDWYGSSELPHPFFFEFRLFTWIENLKKPNLLFTFTKLYVQTKLKYEVASQVLINNIVSSFLFFYSFAAL